MYDSLAIIYDCFTDDIDYNRWADDIDGLLKTNSVFPIKNVVDLACGTGNITSRLAKKGYNLIGIDISEEMLLRAGNNMRKSGVNYNLVKQDISRFSVHKKMDAVLCMCDGVNYLTENSQIDGFFNCCKQALKPNGLLIFDISSEEKLRYILGNNEYFDIRDDACFFWQNEINNNILSLELNIFIREEDGRYIRKTESQKQRIYKEAEIKERLTDFEIINIASVSYDNKGEDKRLQFICRLKEEKK